MPFVNSIAYYPATGKAGEIRALLEERVKALKALGVETNLSATAWGPDYPATRIGQRFATLADYEKYRKANLDATRQFAVRIAPLLRQASMVTLTETLQQTNQSGAVGWTQWNTSAPALGKGPELRALLLERGKGYETEGRRTTLSVQVAGPESGVFTRVFSHASLAALEEQRARTAADPAAPAFLAKLNSLLSRPLEISIRETIIPFATS